MDASYKKVLQELRKATTVISIDGVPEELDTALSQRKVYADAIRKVRTFVLPRRPAMWKLVMSVRILGWRVRPGTAGMRVQSRAGTEGHMSVSFLLCYTVSFLASTRSSYISRCPKVLIATSSGPSAQFKVHGTSSCIYRRGTIRRLCPSRFFRLRRKPVQSPQRRIRNQQQRL